VGLRAGLDRCGKSRSPPGFDPRTVQPVGSRYTDYATRPLIFIYIYIYICIIMSKWWQRIPFLGNSVGGRMATAPHPITLRCWC
jgi:hypothetical protein